MKKIILYLFSKKIFFEIPQDQHNMVIYNDTIGKSILLDGFYEKQIINTITNSFDFDPNSFNCIDVGSNIGNHIVQFSKSFKKCYGFEPQRRTFKILELNTEFLQNVEVFNFGLAKENKIVDFIIPKFHTGGGSNLNENLEYNSNYVESCKLKNFDDQFEIECAFIKIDVEGSELDVLNSMKKTLLNHLPLISIEMAGTEEEKSKILDFLSKIGYSNYFIPKVHFSEKYFKNESKIGLIFRYILKSLFPLKKTRLVKYSATEIMSFDFIQLLTVSASKSKFQLKK